MLAPFVFNYGLTAAAEALCAQLQLPDDTCNDLWSAFGGLSIGQGWGGAVLGDRQGGAAKRARPALAGQMRDIPARFCVVQLCASPRAAAPALHGACPPSWTSLMLPAVPFSAPLPVQGGPPLLWHWRSAWAQPSPLCTFASCQSVGGGRVPPRLPAWQWLAWRPADQQVDRLKTTALKQQRKRVCPCRAANDSAFILTCQFSVCTIKHNCAINVCSHLACTASVLPCMPVPPAFEHAARFPCLL